MKENMKASDEDRLEDSELIAQVLSHCSNRLSMSDIADSFPFSR